MEKEQLDELYHLLRVAALSRNPGDTIAAANIADHLLRGGNYLSLVQYSAYYGNKYLLDPVYEALDSSDIEFGRIVEFGAGLGWLSRGLAVKYAASGRRTATYTTVDKRAWSAMDVVADLETENGISVAQDMLCADDLIIMADFLHCVEDPTRFIDEFPQWPMLVLEYMPTNTEHIVSFHEQLEHFGASSFIPEDIPSMFLCRDIEVTNIEPYVMILATERIR